MSVENSVMVYIQQDGGKIAEVSLELVSKARELADELGVPVSAALFGEKAAGEVPRIAALGADVVCIVEDPRLRFYTPIPYSKLMIRVIKDYKPQIVLYGATTGGRDLAPRVASGLRVGLTADCTDLKIGDHTQKEREYRNILYQIRPAFGGNIIATIVCPEHKPQMATVREGVMRMNAPDTTRKAEILRLPSSLGEGDFPTEILERVLEEKTVNLKGANIVVSGGMGVGTRENFSLIRSLAEVLGGEVGASRAAVDAGLVGKEHQVGQTGATVRPKLYIACGISGAIQHRAGMDGSARIIAINTDPEAPIFSIAQYGILGDLSEVIPRMIKAYKARV
ncbi:MAG: electron transfer flavoprotein subunit alpha/FixB family protein [Spirochaetaceae bacterium]|jgi:electron transfer flavoprotein alpha subunit|nr:electron transfer flavoprotein subunit alpha/FixB family protein [Spirochaetaceae bacterium]